MTTTAIILAGGTGSRAGGGVPKQFHLLRGKPVILYSMQAFHEADPSTRLLLVVHPDWIEHLRGLLDGQACVPPCDIVPGGSSRIASVMCALAHLGAPAADGYVAVHDAARPMVTPSLINRGWETARRHGAAVPVVPLTDSIRLMTYDGQSMPADRSRFCLVQTPQIFTHTSLAEAYAALPAHDLPASLTDDASVLEHAGMTVTLYDGAPDNMKVTNPGDFAVAEALITLRDE